MLGLSQSPQVDPDGPVLQKLLLQGRVAKTNEMYKNHLTFGIIGIQWRKLAYPTVLKVFNDTPAARAGIQPMDEIVAVDSIPLTGLEVNDVTGLIIDVPKSTVILSLRRKGQLSAAVMVRMDVDDIKDPLVRAAYGRTLQRRAGADEKEAPQF
jgi:C-terminal processing protease CtpA/Prc